MPPEKDRSITPIGFDEAFRKWGQEKFPPMAVLMSEQGSHAAEELRGAAKAILEDPTAQIDQHRGFGARAAGACRRGHRAQRTHAHRHDCLPPEHGQGLHGESGTVAGCWWELAGAAPAFVLEVVGDPHRTIARDYGSDIGIDPQVEPGDEVVYLRLEDTTGIWVRSVHQSAADLRDAVARVMENRGRIGRWWGATSANEYVDIAREIYETFGEPMRVTSTHAGDAALSVLSAG